MTKKEMIEAMSDETGATFKDTNETFDAFIKVITGALIQDDKVTILDSERFHLSIDLNEKVVTHQRVKQ